VPTPKSSKVKKEQPEKVAKPKKVAKRTKADDGSAAGQKKARKN